MSPKLANRRIRLLLALFALVFAGTLLRAMWLQGVQARSLSRMAANQHRATVTVPPNRGAIYDRTGFQLAIGEQATTVYADPRQVVDVRNVAVAAGRALRISPQKVYAELADRKRGFVYLARKANARGASLLAKQRLAGLGFYPEERRYYPQRSVASQVLGYAGIDNKGLSGLELALDRILAGKPGRQTMVKDASGRTIDVVSEKQERDGRPAFLTLDHTIQANAEAVLRQTLQRWHAKSATAIVLDPHTGDVLAMAVAPSYDANGFPSVARDLQRNRAITDTYEPGSTFKVVTISGALSEGLVSPLTRFTLPYEIQVADRRIHDAEPRGTETMTVAHILSHSSNVGVITVAKLLGKDRLLSWVSRFGFGHKTKIDYPGESQGILPSYWSGSSIGNVPIGQGIAVTPMQVASAYATVANGGVWIQPHLVDHVGGGVRKPAPRRVVITPLVAAQVRAMLQNVVAEGTGTEAAIPGYTVAGKTGTAAKPDPRGGYSDSRYVASFVGFVPATRPRLVVLVAVDEPRGAIWGGVVAAPAFQQIAKFNLQYLEVPPDAAATLVRR
ncbi:MAG: penicillin-binding protein 2 [Actinomycetota bacterium]|nr:penicillin-binding protein 2 [Actinomycetota bacterium]